MYTLFLELFYPEQYLEYKRGLDMKKVQCEVTYQFYYDYFRSNFNYGFGRLRTDVCCQCTEFDAKISAEKNTAVRKNLQSKKCLHKQKAKVFYVVCVCPDSQRPAGH